jgi:hypothetical protein
MPSFAEPIAVTNNRCPSGDHSAPAGIASDESRSAGGPFGTA